MRNISGTQLTNVEASQTLPIFLLEWQHSGSTEYISITGGDVIYNSQIYVGANSSPNYGGVRIASIKDAKQATLAMPATSTRVGEVQDYDWKDGTCIITYIPLAASDSRSPIATYASSEGLILFDGIIDSSSLNGEVITVTARNKYFDGALVPKFQLSDVADSIPPVGATFEIDGVQYSYEQWYKTVEWINTKTGHPGAAVRPTATAINNMQSQTDKTGYTNLTGETVYLPIIYGRASVPGYVFADFVDGTDRIVAVAWSLGEVFQIQSVYISDGALPGSVGIRHYRGTSWQEINNGLKALGGSPTTYTEDMIFHLPNGDLGVVYTVFNIPAGVLNEAPKFRAVIQGNLVEDTRVTGGAASDPFYNYTELDLDFTSGGTTDSSRHSYPIVFNGDAATNGSSIVLDGTGDSIETYIEDTFVLADNDFTIEIELDLDAAVGSPAGATTETILHATNQSGSPLADVLRLDLVNDSLQLYLSSTGTSWDIASGQDCGEVDRGSPTTRIRWILERIEGAYYSWLNGGQATKIEVSGSPVPSPTPTGLYNTAVKFVIGENAGSQYLAGNIYSFRVSIGIKRYGHPPPVTNSPYTDSGTYTANYVYSQNPALAWSHLAQNTFYGVSATVSNVEEAADYCDELLTTNDCVGDQKRCQIGLAITQPRKITAWLDQLAFYANAIWFPEGSSLKIVPDKGTSTGTDVVLNGDFSSG